MAALEKMALRPVRIDPARDEFKRQLEVHLQRAVGERAWATVRQTYRVGGGGFVGPFQEIQL